MTYIPAAFGPCGRIVAELLAELMTGLGYGQYGAHCNDIGVVITAFLAIDYPGHLIGIHTLMPGYPPPAFDDPAHPKTPAEGAFRSERPPGMIERAPTIIYKRRGRKRWHVD